MLHAECLLLKAFTPWAYQHVLSAQHLIIIIIIIMIMVNRDFVGVSLSITLGFAV